MNFATASQLFELVTTTTHTPASTIEGSRQCVIRIGSFLTLTLDYTPPGKEVQPEIIELLSWAMLYNDMAKISAYLTHEGFASELHKMTTAIGLNKFAESCMVKLQNKFISEDRRDEVALIGTQLKDLRVTYALGGGTVILHPTLEVNTRENAEVQEAMQEAEYATKQ